MTEAVMATCLPIKSGGFPLSVFPKDTTSKLAGFFFTLLFICWCQTEKLWIPFFKGLLVWPDKGSKPFAYHMHSGRFNRLSYTAVYLYTYILIELYSGLFIIYLSNTNLMPQMEKNSRRQLRFCFKINFTINL